MKFAAIKFPKKNRNNFQALLGTAFNSPVFTVFYPVPRNLSSFQQILIQIQEDIYVSFNCVIYCSFLYFLLYFAKMCLRIKTVRTTGSDGLVLYGGQNTFYTSSTSIFTLWVCLALVLAERSYRDCAAWLAVCVCVCVLHRSLHTTMLKHSSLHSSWSKITERALHWNTHTHTPTVPTDIWHTLTSHSAFECHWRSEVFSL